MSTTDEAAGARDERTLRTTSHALRVYLAASSAEADRARAAVAKLTGAGFVVVSTWLDVIAKVGNANPTDATAEQRRGWTIADLDEVASADVLWFLVPPSSAPTRGAWAELGYAYAIGARIVCSGDTRQSIFCALGAEFEHDEAALAHIVGLAEDAA